MSESILYSIQNSEPLKACEKYIYSCKEQPLLAVYLQQQPTTYKTREIDSTSTTFGILGVITYSNM